HIAANVHVEARASVQVQAVPLDGSAVVEFFGVPLDGAQDIVFVIDRSGSMALDFNGDSPRPGESRWAILEVSLGAALEAFDGSIGVGAKFFPTQTIRATEGPCDVFPGLDVAIGPGRVPGILTQFSRFDPFGGTPVGPATREALDALLARADENRAQFIVMATDGAPTCGEDAVGDIVSVVSEAHEVHGIDVYVLGIASPGPEHDLLDRLAVSGGRPRPSTEPQRFYDARDPALLESLLSDIARDLAQCIFAVPVPPGPDDVVEVLVGRETIPRDESREDGWDWTSVRRTQLSLFGAACERAIEAGSVRANILCVDG
ncbi:MAG: VWA domain-containing protein, partial [Myxococcales bacterium]|nr:VWA domain-containing protein [Myxococcales bacterium]